MGPSNLYLAEHITNYIVNDSFRVHFVKYHILQGFTKANNFVNSGDSKQHVSLFKYSLSFQLG